MNNKISQLKKDTYIGFMGSSQFKKTNDQSYNKKIFNLDKIVNVEYKKSTETQPVKYKKHFDTGFRDHLGYYR